MPKIVLTIDTGKSSREKSRLGTEEDVLLEVLGELQKRIKDGEQISDMHATSITTPEGQKVGAIIATGVMV